MDFISLLYMGRYPLVHDLWSWSFLWTAVIKILFC
jgi:hypothetical protein